MPIGGASRVRCHTHKAEEKDEPHSQWIGSPPTVSGMQQPAPHRERGTDLVAAPGMLGAQSSAVAPMSRSLASEAGGGNVFGSGNALGVPAVVSVDGVPSARSRILRA
jgi:hypothetical protein